jgi:hypothetical protein
VENKYDCFRFLVNGLEPCGSAVDQLPSYVESSNFVDIRIFGKNTIVDDTVSSLTAKKTIYQTRNATYGDLYYRNSNSSIVTQASAALSGIFQKYNLPVRQELENNILNFDVYYDTIQIETENYVIFEKLTIDYTTNRISGGGPGVNVISRDNNNKCLEKISTVWFNEQDKELLVCKTVLLHTLSASNYKIVYPKIYSFNLNSLNSVQIFPTVRDENLTFDLLKTFSLSGRNIEVNIVEIDKPLLTYNAETNIYKLSYIGRDLANSMYIFNITFNYINGTLTLIHNTMFKLGSDVYNQNFANPQNTVYFETYPVLNNNVGEVDTANNWFIWGGTSLPPQPPNDSLWIFDEPQSGTVLSNFTAVTNDNSKYITRWGYNYTTEVPSNSAVTFIF